VTVMGERTAHEPGVGSQTTTNASTRNSSSEPGPPCETSSLNNVTFLLRSPLIYTPSAAPMLEQIYLSNFIAAYTCPEGRRAGLHSWVTDLPQMVSSEEHSAVVYASRATTLALYGRLTKSKAVALEARKCYGKCLQLQRDSV